MDYAASAIITGFGRKSIQPAGNMGAYEGPVPVEAVRELFGWDVTPQPVFTTVNGRPVAIPTHVANVRSDNSAILGLTSPKYAIHQFTESLVDNVERIISRDLSVGINTAGYLRGGAVGYVAVSLDRANVDSVTGIEAMPMLYAFGSHDGSLATGYKRSVLNMVCGNAMPAMLSGATGDLATLDSAKGRVKANVRIKHTSGSALRVADAREALGILIEAGDQFTENTRALCQTTISDAEWSAILDELCPIPADGSSTRAINGATAKRDELTGLINSDPRCSPWRGTAWGAVQTFNTWSQHVQPVRGAHRDDRNTLSTLSGDWDSHDDRTVAAVRRVLLRTR